MVMYSRRLQQAKQLCVLINILKSREYGKSVSTKIHEQVVKSHQINVFCPLILQNGIGRIVPYISFRVKNRNHCPVRNITISWSSEPPKSKCITSAWLFSQSFNSINVTCVRVYTAATFACEKYLNKALLARCCWWHFTICS